MRHKPRILFHYHKEDFMTHTSIFKRGFTALMAMLLCLSSFIGLGATTAYAAGEQAEIYLISFPRTRNSSKYWRYIDPVG